MAIMRNLRAPSGEFTRLDGEDVYRIASHDLLQPFLINVPSDSDLWMFISSRGGLTAGRVDPDGSLFAYETVDKLHDAHHHTGPVTLIRLRRAPGRDAVWQPFDAHSTRNPSIERNLYKSLLGNRLIFEEINHDLSLAFRYRWSASDEWGWVRTAVLENRGAESVAVSLLDGLRNVLPYGAPLALYQTSSTLVDAYKHTDLDMATGLAVFALTAQIVDRPEAVEELRANTVWCHGLSGFDVGLAIDEIDRFRLGQDSGRQIVLTGRRGNYLVRSALELLPDSRSQWHVVADVGRSHVQVATIQARLERRTNLDFDLERSLESSRENLLRNVGSTDGIHLTGHEESNAHHLANVLFNNMRGGVFVHNYEVTIADFADFLNSHNRKVAVRRAAELERLPEVVSVFELRSLAERTQDADYQRLTYEYLPLHFGRRHGDPSRPWNRFAIHVKAADGRRALRYEGNWRDIFQNWEALSLSFPGFLPGMIAKFVNCSTVDGFNPYRITRDGFEWEVIDPDDSWSHIGYWGDHQITYLSQLLERSACFAPGEIHDLLIRNIFCYADVPYRLASYRQILRDPRNTITYEHGRAALIESRVSSTGTDGQLVSDAEGRVYHVNLLEKLLVPALSKLSNFVPDAGIWMNTQRPEWNDANNALVGNGVSVVTLCYLRRYLKLLTQLLEGLAIEFVPVSNEVATWLRDLDTVFREKWPQGALETASDQERKQLLDELGEAFSVYRRRVYSTGFTDKVDLALADIVKFVRVALERVDAAIRANRRSDNLYHAYNLLEVSADGTGISIHRLYAMLEGQVAALSSGVVPASEAIELLTSLFESDMYRADQKSFLLYPERQLPAFVDKNRVPEASIDAVPLLRELVNAGEHSIVERDARGVHRFHADLRNARNVDGALDRLAENERWATLVEKHRQSVLEVFEAVFEHRTFTGRSGTMYGFEGLGCIYWHMVSKLLVAVQEITFRAMDDGQPPAVLEALTTFYRRIRDGLGFNKTPIEYGAFPTDPYSHTPAHAGAQQPGMTGQVKEGIVARFGELGVHVHHGQVRFRPRLLARHDFCARSGTYTFFDLDNKRCSIDVPDGALAFTFCQVPVVYELGQGSTWIRVTERDGSSSVHSGDVLDLRRSRALFERSGDVARIDVGVPESSLGGETQPRGPVG